MKTKNILPPVGQRAFTLVEMLVVIAVIATLAAMIFPAFSALKRKAAVQKAQTELKLVASAIQSYKQQYGHYPPGNPTNSAVTGLYYELLGTVQKGANFETQNGDARIPVASVPGTFGQGGFVNSTKGGSDDNAQAAKKFLVELKPTQYGEIAPGIRLLTCSVAWPEKLGVGAAGVLVLNPWRYVSSNPTNNSGEFDLWVDIIVGDKTNRISNWSDKPLIVP